jgi:hypothetical protein
MPSRFATAALCLGVLSLVSARAEAQDHVVEVGVMSWKPEPGLTLSTDTISAFGIEEVDFVQQFGIDKVRFPEFRATIGRSHKARFSYVQFGYEAEATINQTLTYRGQTLRVGAPASTDIEWDLWKFGYEWDFVSRDRGFLGVTADLNLNRVKASVDSPLLTSAASTDTTAPVPTIGVIARGYLSSVVAITGEFSGLKVGGGTDFDVKFIDFDIYGTVGSRNAGVQIGYRSVTADYVIDADTGDLAMKGMYFGAYARF